MEEEAVSVRMALVGVAPPLNDPITPAGKPESVTVTALVKPLRGVNVRVLVPVVPRAMLSEVGDADNVNVGGALMVSAMVVLLLSAPDVPVMVTVGPAAPALADAVKVTVLWPAETAPKVAVTPAGNPEAASATVPLKPFRALIAMLLVPLVPGLNATLAGVAERVKLAGELIVRAMVALLVALPEVPVTVIE
jgi:hypothetical protein